VTFGALHNQYPKYGPNVTHGITFGVLSDRPRQSGPYQPLPHLLLDLLLDLLQVGPQLQVDRVLGAQQGLQHGVGRHADLPQDRLLELTHQVLNFDFEVVNLEGANGGWVNVKSGFTKPHLQPRRTL